MLLLEIPTNYRESYILISRIYKKPNPLRIESKNIAGDFNDNIILFSLITFLQYIETICYLLFERVIATKSIITKNNSRYY